MQRPAVAGFAGDQGEMVRTDSGAGPWLGVWGRFGANRGSESPSFGAGLVVCKVLREKVERGMKDECQVCHMDAWVGVLRWAPKRSLGRSLGECRFQEGLTWGPSPTSSSDPLLPGPCVLPAPADIS